MTVDVLTLCPALVQAYLAESIMGRARERQLIAVNVINIREYTHDRHRTVDDSPYGGGPGMVMKPEPIFEAMDACALWQSHKVYLTPQGAPLTQAKARELAQRPHLTVLCGHYEGVDQRVLDTMDEELSLGDYVLSNGAVAALALLDALVRLVPGALGNEASAQQDTFSEGLLEYPQYTRPPEYRGQAVPAVLLQGNHAAIARWRRAQSISKTRARRPDLLAGAALSAQERRELEHTAQGTANAAAPGQPEL